MLKYLLFVFLSLFCCPMLLAQILSNPRGEDSISAPKQMMMRTVQGRAFYW